ncbi:aminoacyl--tRNA ligase-related protein [Nanoarchaeota archaeon]
MITIPTEEGELIKKGPEGELVNGIDSIDDLFERKIVGEFVKNSGLYVIFPKGTSILNKIYGSLEDSLRDEIGFEELVLNKIIPVETIRKADMLGKWDDYLIVVRPFSSTKGVEEDYILDPLQCTAAYQLMENEVIDTSEGPRKWYDRSGPTYRNEDLDKLEPLVKQREFHRSEFIYVGTKEQIIETRERCLAQLENLCEDLGIKYRIVVGSGCYQLKNGEIKMPESIEEIPIKDLEVYIPFQKRWLEMAGSSVLAQTQTSRFNIKGTDDKYLWSGCTGVGLERFIYAVVANGRENRL